MKSRHCCAPLTEDDLYCWGLVVGRFAIANPGSCIGLGNWFKGDRRDADLMLAWVAGWPIDLGGDDEEGECLFWRVK